MRYLTAYDDRRGVTKSRNTQDLELALTQAHKSAIANPCQSITIYCLDDTAKPLPELVGQMTFELGKTYVARMNEGRIR